MIPMCWPCFTANVKRGYFYMTKGQQCNEYIRGVFATIKNYILSVYRVRVLKPFRISHIILGPLSQENLTLSHVNNKGADQSVHPASLMRAFVICSLESIIITSYQSSLSHETKLLKEYLPVSESQPFYINWSGRTAKSIFMESAQLLCRTIPDLRPRSFRIYPHWRHWGMSLSKTH